MALKYKVGDKVRIKSIDWYNENKDKYGAIIFSTENGDYSFTEEDTRFCGRVVTITYEGKGLYLIAEDERGYFWIDEMIEGLVEEECPQDFIEKYCISCGTQRCDRTKEYLNGCPYYNAYRCKNQNNVMEEKTKPEPKFKVGDILFYRGETSGYLKVEEIREENGEIKYYETSRNVYLIENHPDIFVDKVCSVETEETKPIDLTVKRKETKERIEIAIPEGYEYVIESGKIIFTKKKKEYPKTYEECCKILGLNDLINMHLGFMDEDTKIIASTNYHIKTLILLNCLTKLRICRDAYWKIAGDEMGLGKPWKPDWNDEKQDKYGFYNEVKYTIINSAIFVFPTEEIRDAFYENFEEDIEFCKELL